MNTNNIKNYAPKARTAFIAAMTKRAALFGIRESSIPAMGIAPLEQKGDLVLIGDRAFPASIIRPRAALVKKVEQLGFAQAMEQAAYSWFNRLCAIRYMELKDYLEHGRRVLSATDGSAATPQILDDCLDIDLPGLDKQHIAELKLDATKDEELYRELLLAQCHALHQAMPFLFEAVDDATELLLPDNLTKTDSLIRELVSAIPEEDWSSIEIIGWLYQFYISEKKDQVIGKVVKSEDIPAATQLFTPNWIVKYMVQNSLGAQWLATYPDSPLKAQMEYYIEPAEQTDEVKAQLAAITPESLSPEELTLIDPACGSGHILVEAYDLFKLIYLERGYRQRDVAQLILEKNLFGLDIDVRAAQLTGFALMMKGRADDRRLFERGVKLNVMALQDSGGFDADTVIHGVNIGNLGLQAGDLTELTQLFECATNFGSLIQVPDSLAVKLPALKQLCEATNQDLFVADALKRLGPLVQQADMLAEQYNFVVANPPYMGRRNGLNADLKNFGKKFYPKSTADLYAMFIDRSTRFAAVNARVALVTMHSWLFLPTYSKLREEFLSSSRLESLAHLGPRAFKSISGEVVQVAAFSFATQRSPKYRPTFFRLIEGDSDEKQRQLLERASKFSEVSHQDFLEMPDAPIAYWAKRATRRAFREGQLMRDVADPRSGLGTTDNERFLRQWFEPSVVRISFDSQDAEAAAASRRRWFPYNKGGAFRKWYGNQFFVVNWEADGREIKENLKGRNPDVARSESRYFRSSLTWTDLGASNFGVRYCEPGFIFDTSGSSAFPSSGDRNLVAGFLCSKLAVHFLSLLNPTMHFQVGNVASLPVLFLKDSGLRSAVNTLVDVLLQIAKADWNSFEESWGFQYLPILTVSVGGISTLESSYTAWIKQSRDTIAEMKLLEEENNRLFINAYDLADELTPEVPIEQVTLKVNPAYRYGGNLSEAELWTRFREDSMKELVSYAVGCMLGRYSLDEPGLIYAHGDNQGFDPRRYTSFPADADGILPFTDKEWFADDAANRLIEFVSVAWDKTHLETNLRFLADNLSPKKTESSRDTLRRYLCDNFFKDHLQTYKKRPIYWLFSSGKHKAFQCLVYLHRYNEGTLARMRTEYVIPLTAKFNTYATKLEQDIEASTSTAEKKRLEKELAALHNQQAELATFDEKLRHYADQRISLDLDDGVKVNYAKFGDLLAEVKAVTGDKSSD